MCNSHFHQFLHDLPKCEHHLHIEGTLSPSLLFNLARSNNINLPGSEVDASFESPETLESRYERFTSLNDFLHYYFIGMSVLVKASDFEALAYEYFTRAYADGVHHAEVFFDPQAHTSRGVAYTTVVSGLTAAQKRAEKNYGLSTKLILCFLRHLSPSDAKTTYQEAVALGHFSDGSVAGIGLSGSEVGFPPELSREIYASAREAGIRRTAHAGEEGDSTYISRSLDVLHVQRIDHGIRLADDEALLKRVAMDKILITLCPLSNIRLRCVAKVTDLPVRKFLDAGVSFSINSDDPAYFGSYILDNYCAVQEAFHLSLGEWKGIAVGAVQASWCDEERKRVLLAKVQECFEKYKVLA